MSELVARKVFELKADHADKYEKERAKTGLSHAAFVLMLLSAWIELQEKKKGRP